MTLRSLAGSLAILAMFAAPADLWARGGGGGGRGGGGGGGGFRGGGGGGGGGYRGGNAGGGYAGGNRGMSAGVSRGATGGSAMGRSGFAGTMAGGGRANSAFYGNNGAFAGNGYGTGYRGGNGGYGRYPGYGGMGYGGYGGYGGIGYGGLGLGLMMGMGYGLGYGGYGGGGYGGYGGGYGYGNNNGYYSASSPNASPTPPNAQMAAAATDFEIKAEDEFRAGQYQQAANDFKHALVDNPQNGGNGLLLGQALFATGQFEQAAAITAASLNQLPQDKWGAVITNYKQLYGNQTDYNTQLKALETARDAAPDSAGLRFLLGYHFGFLGYPKQAVRELDRAIALAPQEPFAALLRNDFGAKIGLPPVTVPTPPQPPVRTPAAIPGQTQAPSQPPGDALPVLSTN